MLVFSKWPSSPIACHWFFTWSCCKHLYYCWLQMPVYFLPETKLCFGCARWIKSRNLFLYEELNSHEVAFRSDPAIIRLTDWKTLCFSSCSFQNQSLTWLIISLPVCLECKVVLDSMHAPGFNSRISSFDQNLDWDRKISKSNLKERKKEEGTCLYFEAIQLPEYSLVQPCWKKTFFLLNFQRYAQSKKSLSFSKWG